MLLDDLFHTWYCVCLNPTVLTSLEYRCLFKLWFSLAYRPRSGIARPRGCSVAQSCPALCNSMHCSMPGFPVLHHLLKFAKLMSTESVSPSNYLISASPFFSCLQSFPASGSFSMSQLFPLGGQSIGASAPVLPMNIQGWFPLGLSSYRPPKKARGKI